MAAFEPFSVLFRDFPVLLGISGQSSQISLENLWHSQNFVGSP
jgi:hypothetical protein